MMFGRLDVLYGFFYLQYFKLVMGLAGHNPNGSRRKSEAQNVSTKTDRGVCVCMCVYVCVCIKS